MSAQPPGYNPGESLLQGGTATIQPMMGGGHGNPEISLLQGGNSATIIPLKGGRRKMSKTKSKTKIKGLTLYATIATITTIPPFGISKKGGQKKKVY